MILDVKWKSTYSDELWKLIVRANNLTKGSYSSWADNAQVLIRLMERIIALSRKECAWEVYFYTILKLIYLVCRGDVMDSKEAFKIAELYHHDYPLYMALALAENSTTGYSSLHICALILEFYLSYPQITDEKIDQMLELFYENDARFGSKYHTCSYRAVMRLALINKDRDMARSARLKLEATDYSVNCYVCYYAKPVLGEYILNDDYDSVIEMIQRVYEKTIPARYQWCYDRCEGGSETDMVSSALHDCLKLGNASLFKRLFMDKIQIFRQPDKEVDTTSMAALHALAGDGSMLDQSLRLAEKDNRSRQQNRETPLDSLYDALYWDCFFRLLDKSGVHRVKLELDNPLDLNNPIPCSQEENSLWACMDAAAYFEQQADEIGAQMDASRRRFQYGLVKQSFRECLCQQTEEY